MVQVFLVRHADATDDDVPDALRALTPLGRVQSTYLGDRMRWYDCAATHIWTSPYARAVETCELLVAAMTDRHPIEVRPELGPHGSPRAIFEAIGALPPRSAVLLVGHEPSLSSIGGLLTGLEDFPAIPRAHAVRIVDGHLRWHFAWNGEAPVKPQAP